MNASLMTTAPRPDDTDTAEGKGKRHPDWTARLADQLAKIEESIFEVPSPHKAFLELGKPARHLPGNNPIYLFSIVRRSKHSSVDIYTASSYIVTIACFARLLEPSRRYLERPGLAGLHRTLGTPRGGFRSRRRRSKSAPLYRTGEKDLQPGQHPGRRCGRGLLSIVSSHPARPFAPVLLQCGTGAHHPGGPGQPRRGRTVARPHLSTGTERGLCAAIPMRFRGESHLRKQPPKNKGPFFSLGQV